jgi:hypothetical protein
MPSRVSMIGILAASLSASAAAEYAFTPRPGPLDSLHPDYELSTLLPGSDSMKIVGMDWLPGGDMAILALQDSNIHPVHGGSQGWVHVLSGARGAPAVPGTLRTVYRGLKYPMGLAAAGADIHVSQRGSLVRLADRDADGLFDSLVTIAVYPDTSWDAWGKWALNLRYRDGVFYTGLGADHWVGRAGPCLPSPDRGTVHAVDRQGRVELLGRGLREPNGIGFGPEGELFATDNDGEWVAANKLVHVRKDDFFGLVPCQAWDPSLVHTLPAVWFPEHLRSPGQPLAMPGGPFRGQLIVGDYEVLGLSRIFLEKVGGRYQGALFPFTGGLGAGGLRLLADEDGALYAGEIVIENHEGWWFPGEVRPTPGGLQKLVPKASAAAAFEMLAIRAQPRGLELEFTRPAASGAADPAAYRVSQWRLKFTAGYGSDRHDLEILPVAGARLSADRRKADLEIPGLEPDRVVHVQLHDGFRAADGSLPWAYEAWYTLNAIPGLSGSVPPPSSRETGPRFTLRRSAAGRRAIALDLPAEAGRIVLLDLRGRPVFESPFTGRGEVLLPAGLPAGLYVLRVQSGGGDHRFGLPVF